MSESSVDWDRPSGVGRKRDPMIEPRVYDAAVDVYAREGWGGFTFDAIAREAKVGKPAIYRRWSSREELLIRALDRDEFPVAVDRGGLRADLLDYAHQWVRWYRNFERSLAMRRLLVDVQTNAALRELWVSVLIRPRVESARDVTRRAVARGELDPSVHSATVVDLLVGGLANHVDFTSERGRARLPETLPAYAELLVDVVLAGIEVASGQAELRPVRPADHPGGTRP